MDFFKIRKRDKCYYIGNWYTGWHSWTFDISVEECGYEEPNMELNIALLGWFNHFKLPFKSKRFPDGDCDAPSWGILIHDNTLWLHYGGYGNGNGGSRYKTWSLPFFEEECISRTIPCYKKNADGSLSMEIEQAETKDLEAELKAMDGKWHPVEDSTRLAKTIKRFNDSYDGKEITAFYYTETMTYRRKWFGWLKFLNKVYKRIEITFDKECGPGQAGWKGGTSAISSLIHKGETLDDAFIRVVGKEYAQPGSIR